MKVISKPGGGCVSLLSLSNGHNEFKEWTIFENARHMAETFIAYGDWRLKGTEGLHA